MSATAYIGFGSNLGDRQLQFERAVQALDSLPGTVVTGASRLYETDPVALSDDGTKFLNSAIAVETDLSASDLAQHMRAVEMALGKSPSHRSDKSRSIDLDLLLYGTERVSTEGLEVPHPRMHLRGFVLVPLAELAPTAVVPTLHCTVADLVGNLSEQELAGVRLWSNEKAGDLASHQIREWLRAKHVGQAFQPAFMMPELRSLAREDLQAVSLYRRKLPHWELEGSTYFVTFRVHNTLGQILGDHRIASIIEEALWFGHDERYVLQAYVIMPDHVHLLLQPAAGWSLARILQGLKGATARQINIFLGRKGIFWQDESLDHLVRNEQDWIDKFDYIHENPVKSGLVTRPQDYPFSSLVTIHSEGRLESLPHKNRTV